MDSADRGDDDHDDNGDDDDDDDSDGDDDSVNDYADKTDDDYNDLTFLNSGYKLVSGMQPGKGSPKKLSCNMKT